MHFVEQGTRVCSRGHATEAREVRCPTTCRERSTSIFQFRESWIPDSDPIAMDFIFEPQM